MNKPTSMDRARAWVRKAAGLAVLPIVLATVAPAAVVFNPANSGQSCVSLPEGPNGVQGVKCFGLYTTENPLEVDVYFSGVGNSEVFGVDEIPFDWNFTVYRDGFGNTAVNEDLYTGSILVTVNEVETSFNLSGEVGVADIGSGMVGVPLGSGLEGWSVSIVISGQDPLSNTILYLDIPQNSIDINAIRGAAVPEPASALLIGAGLVALGLYRRRR